MNGNNSDMMFLSALPILVVVGVFIIKIATSAKEPAFYSGARLSPSAVMFSVRELAKSCVSTERGNGIAYSRLLRRLENLLARFELVGEERGELWESILSDGCGLLRTAADKCRNELSASAKLGHVGGVPRIFAFCNLFSGATHGSFDAEFYGRAKSLFCEYVTLDECEDELLTTMLLFCLCAMFVRAAEEGERCNAEFARGVNDGKQNAAALDMLSSADYVCGLMYGLGDDSTAEKLFADNGIVPNDARAERKERSAELAQTLYSICAAISDISGEKFAPRLCGGDGVYFGGETTRRENALKTRNVTATADNRGKISLGATELSVCADIFDDSISLCDFDGVFQSHRTVYRTFTESAELRVQVTAPPADDCCLVLFEVINRTPHCLPMRINFACKRKVADGFEENGVRVCEFGVFGNREVGLSSDAPCEYRFDLDGKAKRLTLCAERISEVCAFGVVRVTFAVTIEKRVNASSLSRFADRLYFERAEVSARAYYSSKYADNICDIPSATLFKFYRAQPDLYSSAEYPRAEEFVCGNYMQNGYFTDDIKNSGSLSSSVFDGEMYSEITVGGKGRIVLPDGQTFGLSDIILEERGVIWSPCGELSGNGAACALCRGYAEYIGIRNGCVVKLTRTISAERCAEVALLELINETDDDRNIFIMFTSPSDCIRTVKGGGGVFALGENGFALFSSEPVFDYCGYAEGYLDHGKITRAAHFKRGGETSAPTVSVSVCVSPHARKTVAFCRVFSAGGDCSCGISAEDAQRTVEYMREKYGEYGSVILQSSDPELNTAHVQSLYAARGGLYANMNCGRYDRALLTCFAVKYADFDAVTAAVFKLCEMQESCGRLDVGRKTPIATLLLPLVVIDAVKFCGDCRILSERAGFKNVGGAVKPASVLEHCFRAIDFSTVFYAGADENTDGAFLALLLRAVREFSQYTANTDRIKAYASVSARLSRLCERRRARVAAAEIAFDALGAATAHARYDGENDEYAYSALKELADKSLSGADGAPPLLKNEDGVAAALFYTAVTEKFLGISVRGARAKISPRTALGTPHIEFDVKSGEYGSHFLIDDEQVCGGWQINIDRISIASDTVSLDGCGNIVMRRSGEAC